MDKIISSKAKFNIPRYIVGLGNFGNEFKNTRHNLGIKLVKMMAYNLGLDDFIIDKKSGVMFTDYNNNGINLSILYPISYMNICGPKIYNFIKTGLKDSSRILVCHDELELNNSIIKMKFSGSHLGHNGLKSLINEIQTRDFWRVRIGIGRPNININIANYVLSKPNPEEMLMLETSLQDISMKICNFIKNTDDNII